MPLPLLAIPAAATLGKMMTIPFMSTSMVTIIMPLSEFITTSSLYLAGAAGVGGVIAWNIKEPVIQTAYAVGDSIGSAALAWQETVGETSLNWFGF